MANFSNSSTVFSDKMSMQSYRTNSGADNKNASRKRATQPYNYHSILGKENGGI